jgi:hypothetical protein
MTTPDYETYNAMTPEQKQDWYREQKQSTQSLAEEITQFLRRLHDFHVLDSDRSESGMWNCHDWLVRALANRNIRQFYGKRRGRRAANMRFQLHGGTCEIAEQDIRLDTYNDADTQVPREITPRYLGTMVELSLWGTSPGSNYRLMVRWLAYDSDTAQSGMLVDDFWLRAWQFPAHLWCDFEGRHEDARDWLSKAELVFNN